MPEILPINDKKLESTILGGVLIDEEAYYEVSSILKPECFYDLKNREVWGAMVAIVQRSEKINLVTVVAELRASTKFKDENVAFYVSNLTSSVASAYNIENHSKILYELYLRREMLHTFAYISKDIEGNKDIFETYNKVSAELSNLFEMSLSSDFFDISEILKERLSIIQDIKAKEGGIIGINSGFSSLNNLTGGFQPGDYIILGARPSMGKTIVSLLAAKAAAQIEKKKVLYFSLEMSKERIADRLLSVESSICSRKISSNNLDAKDWGKLEESASGFVKDNFFIIDSSGLTIEDIKAKAITLHRKFGIDEIVIDYIQLIRHSFSNRNTNDNVTHISKNIKTLAKEINCPVLALSQLKRSNEGVMQKPVMQNLRDSGTLEQDADIIWFLHREDYEGRDVSEIEPDAECRIENIIAKNRNGAVGFFYTYRNDNWSYLGEMHPDELNSIVENMPFDVSEGIEPVF